MLPFQGDIHSTSWRQTFNMQATKYRNILNGLASGMEIANIPQILPDQDVQAETMETGSTNESGTSILNNGQPLHAWSNYDGQNTKTTQQITSFLNSTADVDTMPIPEDIESRLEAIYLLEGVPCDDFLLALSNETRVGIITLYKWFLRRQVSNV